MEKSQGFGCQGWLGGGGGGWRVWLVTEVVEEDLSIPVPRVKADTVSLFGMWLWFRHISLQLWLLDSGLDAGLVRALLLWRRVFRRPGWGSGWVCVSVRWMPATKAARDVIARNARVSSPLAGFFRPFLRRVWLDSLAMALSESMSLARVGRPPPSGLHPSSALSGE